MFFFLILLRSGKIEKINFSKSKHMVYTRWLVTILKDKTYNLTNILFDSTLIVHTLREINKYHVTLININSPTFTLIHVNLLFHPHLINHPNQSSHPWWIFLGNNNSTIYWRVQFSSSCPLFILLILSVKIWHNII